MASGEVLAWFLPLIFAAIGALAPLWAMAIIMRNNSRTDFSNAQSQRIADLLRQLEECQAERRRLEGENVSLMRQLFGTKDRT